MAVSREHTALLLIAHGERSQGGRNRSLLSHAAALRDRLRLGLVTAAVLRGEPDLESAIGEARRAGMRRLVVYPFFMSDGYFVRTLLPERLNDLALDMELGVLEPLGLDPSVPDLMRLTAIGTALSLGLEPRTTPLMIVGHGSKLGAASARATRAAALHIERSGTFPSVEAVFLEEPPLMLTELASATAPLLLSGFFSAEGLHSTVDVEAAIQETGSPAHYTGPIGAHPGIVGIVEAAVSAHLAGSGA